MIPVGVISQEAVKKWKRDSFRAERIAKANKSTSIPKAQREIYERLTALTDAFWRRTAPPLSLK